MLQDQGAVDTRISNQITETPFLDITIESLGNIRENLSRACGQLADAGFYGNPTAAPAPPPTDKPDTKRASVVEILRNIEAQAILLVQQVNKVV
jgi:hypothetical protein